MAYKKVKDRKIDIASLARSHSETAIRVLAGLASQETVPPASRIAACQALLDRGFGRAAQSIDLNATVEHRDADALDTLLVRLSAMSSRSPTIEADAIDADPVPIAKPTEDDTQH